MGDSFKTYPAFAGSLLQPQYLPVLRGGVLICYIASELIANCLSDPNRTVRKRDISVALTRALLPFLFGENGVDGGTSRFPCGFE
jgi:hypothetical protein